MDLADLKEKMRSIAPLELLKRLKNALLSSKKKLMLFGLGGAGVLLFGLVAIVVIRSAAKPGSSDVFNIALGSAIPAEEFFYPPEPDFLPDFIPERESRRFWSLEDIRQYWRTPGDSGWWMEEIKTTVDSLMEGVP